jgi:tetratricopeptide (TPR) repeat protein
MIQIRHKETGQLLLRVEGDSLSEAPPDILSCADLRGADLRRLDLSGIDFSHQDLTGADLSQAHLIGTRLTDANLTRAHLQGARFDHRTEWPDAFEPQEHGAIKVEWRGGAHRLERRHRELHAESSRHWKHSIARLRAGQAAAAIAELRRAIPRSPSSAGEAAFALTLQGMIRILKRHTMKALSEFREAIRLYPHLAVAHVALAYTLVLRESFEEAFAAYQRALQIAPYDRHLYLPLLRSFEQAGKHEELFAAHSDLLFPDAERPISPSTVPNPVEQFLERQPDQLERALCVLVLGELIDGRPVTVLPSYLRERRQWPDYAVNQFVSWLGELAPVPELSAVWEFLSGSSYQVECRFMDYWAQMEVQALAREQIQRRMEIVESFQKLCEELGYAWAEEDLPFPDWP